ncbi:MAG: phosphodiester glycosidase family protein [Acetivibrionales bacterium]
MTKKNRIRALVLLAAVVILSLILQYAGSFLFIESPNQAERDKKPVQPRQAPLIPPVKYSHLSKTINGLKQEINIIMVDLRDEQIRVKPVLSFDSVFGFEKLSEMAKRKGAYAAVNSGFFYEYGRPSGMVVIDGELITKSTGKYPVFTVLGREAALNCIDNILWMECGGKKLIINDINAPGNPGDIILYTPAYGERNRAGIANITAAIEESIVIGISEHTDSAHIPENGMALTFFTLPGQGLDNIPVKKGDKVRFGYDSGFDTIDQAYECGSWIVKDGEIVIGDNDEWVGVMTNRDPRTAIGLKDKHTVVLLTVDGRQPGYSAGLTGKELGQLLLELGIKNAAMLDGGASTEMIVEGKVVNRPSFKQQERPLAGAIIVEYQE